MIRQKKRPWSYCFLIRIDPTHRLTLTSAATLLLAKRPKSTTYRARCTDLTKWLTIYCKLSAHDHFLTMLVQKWLSNDHVWWSKSKPGCRIVGQTHFLTTDSDVQVSCHVVCGSEGVVSSRRPNGFPELSRVGGWLKTSVWIGQSWQSLILTMRASVVASLLRELRRYVSGQWKPFQLSWVQRPVMGRTVLFELYVTWFIREDQWLMKSVMLVMVESDRRQDWQKDGLMTSHMGTAVHCQRLSNQQPT